MKEIDLHQNNKINALFALFGALGGVAAFLIWYSRQKNAKIEREILELDRNIKSLQLRKMINGKE